MSSPDLQRLASRLSVAERDELVKHVGSEQPFVAYRPDNRGKTIASLLRERLIKGEPLTSPKKTSLTVRGREVAAIVLGEYADALVAAGCLDRPLRPIQLALLVKSASDRSGAHDLVGAFPGIPVHPLAK
jgi:hypothetical protein